jgi:hypothetical protein
MGLTHELMAELANAHEELAMALELLTDAQEQVVALQQQNAELRKLPELLERWMNKFSDIDNGDFMIYPNHRLEWEVVSCGKHHKMWTEDADLEDALQWVLDNFEVQSDD